MKNRNILEHPTKGNIDFVKQLNMATVYQAIKMDGPVSRTRINEITEIAASSVTKITKQLMDSGLIEEFLIEESTGGRRATQLTTSNNTYHIISVKLGRGYLKVELNSMSGEKISGSDKDISLLEPKDVLEQTFKTIDKILKKANVKTEKIIGIGLSVPGLIDPEAGILIQNPFYNFNNLNISRLFEDYFKIPTFLDNDTNSMALAEYYYGSSKGTSDSILISVKHGIGSGIIVDGKIFYSSNHNAGEIGHIFIDELGSRCDCGNFGCLETVAANPSIIQYTKKLLNQKQPSSLHKITDKNPENLKISDICDAANNGDLLSQNILKRVGLYLGTAIATTINLFNTDMIILSGDIVNASEYLFPAIKKEIDTKALKNFAQRIKIKKSMFNDNEVIGAFALVQRALLRGQLFSRVIKDF